MIGDVQYLPELQDRFRETQSFQWRDLVEEQSMKHVLASQKPDYQPTNHTAQWFDIFKVLREHPELEDLDINHVDDGRLHCPIGVLCIVCLHSLSGVCPRGLEGIHRVYTSTYLKLSLKD